MLTTLERLKKRKLFEWSLAYLAAAWFLLQFVDVLAEHWPIPVGLLRGLDLVLLVGFFAAVTIAWYHGEKGRQRVTGPELLILAGLLVVAGLLLSLLRTDDDTAPSFLADETAPAIAVLPFRGLSADAPEYFVSGLHEALIASLSQIQGLRVIARTSVIRYADSDRPASEIAGELGVSAVIEGSVNAIDDRVRITVKLVDGGNDSLIWVEEYDRDLRDVLVMMSLVATSVAGQVEVSLAPDEQKLLDTVSPVDPELHDLYMRGRYAYAQFTAAGLAQAIQYFERAIDLDPDYAPAWAGLAGSNLMARYLGHVTESDTMASAERAALRAVELDPQLSTGYTALAWVRLFQFEWEEARQLFARSLDLNPNEVDALHGYGDYLTITGSADDGLTYVIRARENDPYSPIWGHSVVNHLFVMRRYEQTIAEANEVLELIPNSPAFGIIGDAYWELGRLEDAISIYRQALAFSPELAAGLEAGYVEDGPLGAARGVADVLAAAAQDSASVTLAVAIWYARAGAVDETLLWLQGAFDARAPDLIYVVVRPELELVHDHPAFLDILERMGLSVYLPD